MNMIEIIVCTTIIAICALYAIGFLMCFVGVAL
jgi:prepilin-type N-terminal cleavage/methylation domain-containing protein